MSFDYTIKPCSSAQPVKNSDPTSSNFGEVLQPIRYDGVGCPGVILSENKIICSNGDIFNPESSLLPCNNYNNESSCVSSSYASESCVWNVNNSICETNKLINSHNTLNFNIGQLVFIEDVLASLRNIFDENTMHEFLTWNNRLLNELANIRQGCGTTSATVLKGKIAAITNNVFGNGRIMWDGVALEKNPINYPNNWPSEIFWVELINGENVGLENFSKGRPAYNMFYQEKDSDGNWQNQFNIQNLPNFNNRSLYPILRNQITNLQTRLSIQKTNTINRSQIMNTPRFRRTGSCGVGSLCLDTTLTPSFKNSTKNLYLAAIPYGQRLGNTFRSSQIRGTKKIVRKNCVDPQFGRLVGTGGARIVNKF